MYRGLVGQKSNEMVYGIGKLGFQGLEPPTLIQGTFSSDVRIGPVSRIGPTVNWTLKQSNLTLKNWDHWTTSRKDHYIRKCVKTKERRNRRTRSFRGEEEQWRNLRPTMKKETLCEAVVSSAKSIAREKWRRKENWRWWCVSSIILEEN